MNPAGGPPPAGDDAGQMAARYARRGSLAGLYDPLRPEVMLARHERQQALAALLRRHVRQPLGRLELLEIGCGGGDNLLELLQLGFAPERLLANELLPDRAAAARARLPSSLRLVEGDALALPLPAASLDLVLQSTVFSSLLDPAFRIRLAKRLWQWLRPGGAVIWYDFTWDNPRNPDVRGMPRAELARLFPDARIDARRVTLAPPLARRVAASPLLLRTLGALPPLRTHLLAWIAKPHA